MTNEKYIADDFDFSETLKIIAPFIDPKHPDYHSKNRGGAKALLSMSQFPEFAAHYFAAPEFWPELHAYQYHKKNIARATPDMSTMELYNQFASENFPNRNKTTKLFLITGDKKRAYPNKLPPENTAIRKQQIYPLSLNETELTEDFIEKNPDYELAMIGIKMCLVDYFELIKASVLTKMNFDLNKEGKDRSVSQKMISGGYRTLFLNVVDFSFLQDLMPVLANTMRQNKAPFSRNALHDGFRSAFARHAFQSMNHNSGGYKKCPFAATLTNLMRIELKPQQDGTFISEKTNTPGALIISVRDIIREKYFQALPENHAVFDAMEDLRLDDDH